MFGLIMRLEDLLFYPLGLVGSMLLPQVIFSMNLFPIGLRPLFVDDYLKSLSVQVCQMYDLNKHLRCK